MAPLELGQVGNCTNCLCGNSKNAIPLLRKDIVPDIECIENENATIFMSMQSGKLCYFPYEIQYFESFPVSIKNGHANAIIGGDQYYSSISKTEKYPISNSVRLNLIYENNTYKRRFTLGSSLREHFSCRYSESKNDQYFSPVIGATAFASGWGIFGRNDKIFLVSFISGGGGTLSQEGIVDIQYIIQFYEDHKEILWEKTYGTEHDEWVDAMIASSVPVENSSEFIYRINNRIILDTEYFISNKRNVISEISGEIIQLDIDSSRRCSRILRYSSNGTFIRVEYPGEIEDELFVGYYYRQESNGIYHRKSSLDEFSLQYEFDNNFLYDVAFPVNRMIGDTSLSVVTAIRYNNYNDINVSGSGIDVGISSDFGKTFEWMPVNYITCEEFSQMTGTDALLSHIDTCRGCGPPARNRGDDYTRRHA